MYYLLFTTNTCFRCPEFKKNVLKNVNFEGHFLDETKNDFLYKAQQFSIMSVPSIVVFKDSSQKEEIFRTSEEYNLINWLKENKL